MNDNIPINSLPCTQPFFSLFSFFWGGGNLCTADWLLPGSVCVRSDVCVQAAAVAFSSACVRILSIVFKLKMHCLRRREPVKFKCGSSFLNVLKAKTTSGWIWSVPILFYFVSTETLVPLSPTLAQYLQKTKRIVRWKDRRKCESNLMFIIKSLRKNAELWCSNDACISSICVTNTVRNGGVSGCRAQTQQNRRKKLEFWQKQLHRGNKRCACAHTHTEAETGWHPQVGHTDLILWGYQQPHETKPPSPTYSRCIKRLHRAILTWFIIRFNCWSSPVTMTVLFQWDYL